ncbi:MAG: TIGR02677 family protein [Solirubrobacteraceae bacterium]
MAELSAALVRSVLELAGAAAPASRAGADPVTGAPERLGAHRVLSYATADEAETYRRIMRVLYLEHQAFGLRLRPAEVADRLRERYALSLDTDLLEARLRMLDDWGAVERDHDASLASTAAEWRRNRYTYDVTAAGRLTEELLTQLDVLGEEIGRLDTARLPAIRDALANLAQGLERDEPDGTHLRPLFEHLLAEVEALHAGALAFMRSLGNLMRAVERVSEEEFERGKGALLEHLQGFRRSRMGHSAEILALIDRIETRGPDQLVSTIVAAEVFVELPGGATVEEQRARRSGELLERWAGLRAWFVGEQERGSPWRTLNDQVVDAIRAVLAIAERLIERHTQRIDRAAVLLRLAGRVAAAPPGESTAWLRAAFGVRSPRHVGVPHSDDEQLTDRGRVSWLQAPAAPVVAHLRTPGVRATGTGRGARIADLSEGRRRFEERRRAEHRELAELLARLSTGGQIKLSSLERVNHSEFRHLLAWIGRAYESPAGLDGARRAASTDGRATIALREPRDPHRTRTRLRAPHGTLELPDYELEVITR